MKKFTLFLMSLFLTLGTAMAQRTLDLTFTKVSETEATVNVQGTSLDATGITATITSNYNWKVLDANSETFPNASMLCPDKNTKDMTAGNEGVFTITIKNIPEKFSFKNVTFTSAALNGSGKFQSDGANAQKVNFTLKNGDTTLGTVNDKVIKVNSNAGESVNVPFEVAEAYTATDGTLVLTLTLSVTESKGCFYGLTKISIETELSKVLNDGEEYTETEDEIYDNISYNREFEHTEWQALYVPFSIDIEAVKNEFSIARIVQLSEYEDNTLRIRAQVLENGVTEANCPYFIKPKNSGAFTIKVNNTTLKKAESNTLSCETIEWGANFVGVYSPVTNMADEGYYGLANGAFKQASSNSVHLGSYRWYLEIINKKNISSINGVKLYIEREGTTSIEDIDNNIAAPVYYDLSGRRVENPTRGIYIVNGSKVYVK